MAPWAHPSPQPKQHLDWFLQGSLVWQTDRQTMLLCRQQQTASTYVVPAMRSNKVRKWTTTSKMWTSLCAMLVVLWVHQARMKQCLVLVARQKMMSWSVSTTAQYYLHTSPTVNHSQLQQVLVCLSVYNSAVLPPHVTNCQSLTAPAGACLSVCLQQRGITSTCHQLSITHSSSRCLSAC